MSQELSLPENPTPQDWGLPENPTSKELARWHRQEIFLESMTKHGSIAGASIETGIPVATVESWDYRDVHGFKKRLAHARLTALGYAELELANRVFNGYDQPLHHKGEIINWYKRKEPTDLYFMLKKYDPSYRDNHQVNVDARQYVTQITINPPSTDSSTSNVIDAQPQPQPELTDSATDTDAE